MQTAQKLLNKIRNPLVAGTAVLTVTGLASRMIGFFYRIFLSRLFGEESMGIYQLISPVMALVFSLSAAGIQNAVSKFVAGRAATHDYKASARILLVGFAFSLSLSLACTAVVRQNAGFISAYLLFEPRCAPLLRIAALSFPFASVHSCINGYFYGIRRTGVPAVTQLTEQLFRVGSVYLIAQAALRKGQEPGIAVAAAGLAVGELGSMLAALPAAYFHFARRARGSMAVYRTRTAKERPGGSSAAAEYLRVSRQILGFAAPLCLNRLCLNLLQAIEAACIPAKLQVFGHSVSESLSVYGVLTGMALPLIFFPGTLTNSAAVLLMPAISEADSLHDHRSIRRAVRRCFSYCLLLGGVCCFLFLVFGHPMGMLIFGSETAGHFIMILGFMCPFLYLNTTLTSILHGLGKTGCSFFVSLTGLLLRLLFVFQGVPVYGIKGYLAGMLLSQIYTTVCCMGALRRYY